MGEEMEYSYSSEPIEYNPSREHTPKVCAIVSAAVAASAAIVITLTRAWPGSIVGDWLWGDPRSLSPWLGSVLAMSVFGCVASIGRWYYGRSLNLWVRVGAPMLKLLLFAS